MLLFLHHSSIPSWEDRTSANSWRTESFAGAWKGKRTMSKQYSKSFKGGWGCLDWGILPTLTWSKWRVERSILAELKLRQWFHPRSNNNRDRGWNSNFSRFLRWENSSCLIRSSAVTYRKDTWMITLFNFPITWLKTSINYVQKKQNKPKQQKTWEHLPRPVPESAFHC